MSGDPFGITQLVGSLPPLWIYLFTAWLAYAVVVGALQGIYMLVFHPVRAMRAVWSTLAFLGMAVAMVVSTPFRDAAERRALSAAMAQRPRRVLRAERRVSMREARKVLGL